MQPPPLENDPAREQDRRKLIRTKWLGAALLPASLALGWYTIYQPLQEARRTGQLIYSGELILWVPLLFYAGMALLLADMRDARMSTLDGQGRKIRTWRAWIFMAGALIVVGISAGLWFWYLHVLGFHAV